ncbi:hypothetical protein Asd1617_05865 [Shigella dysenteriae 1617]|uniref:Uncharacterized protein n=1 Tax=Shigella dysenteriae 1617 TaxID=754093 RepID=A0A0A7A373_SHIDY|nr:hypothetical protein Asd1617_05865 [Shigella dysenteriae 1617]
MVVSAIASTPHYLIETNAYLKLISLINNHQNGLNDLLISIC